VKTLKEKLEVIKLTLDTFGKKGTVSFSLEEIIKNLKIEELLDDSFEKELIPLVSPSDASYSPEQRFIYLIESYQFSNIVNSTFKEDVKKIIDKYIRLAIKGNAKVSLRDNRLFSENENYFISELFRTKSLNFFLKSNFNDIKSFLDSTMAKSDYTTIQSLLEYLTENKFEYLGYPLVVLNKNVSSEQKIEIIKKTYIQKNLNKYTDFMRRNIVDLMDLDAFIEATIIQNNRVKEKTAGVVNLVKRIFIGIKGNDGSLEMSKLENKDKFFEKYKVYFTPAIVAELTNDRSSYYIRRNASSLIVRMFKNATFEEKIAISKMSERVGDELFSNSTDIPADVRGNSDKEILFFEYILKRFGGIDKIYENFGKEKTIEYVKKYKDTFKSYITKTFKITDRYNSWSTINEKIVTEFLVEMDANLLKDESFLLYREEEDAGSDQLGVGRADNLRHYNMVSVFNNYYNHTLKNIASLLRNPKCSEDLKEKVFKDFFSKLENEEFVMSDLLERLSNVLSNGEFISDLKNRSNSFRIVNDSDIFKLIFDMNLAVIKEFFPNKYDSIKENLDKLRTSLSIIINI
jgi:hypothetical protein